MRRGHEYDLLIQGGEVVDPGAGLRGLLDVGIAGGKIVEVGPALSPQEARAMLAAAGRCVTQSRARQTAPRRRTTLKDGRVLYRRPAD